MSEGLMCECGNMKPSRKRHGCERCTELEHQRQASESTTGRLLAMMRRMDWVLASDIAEAANVSRDIASASLANMVRRGEIEQMRVPKYGVVYRMKQQRRAA